MRYQYTPTTGDPDHILRAMAENGWKVHSYHITVQEKLGQYITTHHLLWEVDDHAANEYRGAV